MQGIYNYIPETNHVYTVYSCSVFTICATCNVIALVKYALYFTLVTTTTTTTTSTTTTTTTTTTTKSSTCTSFHPAPYQPIHTKPLPDTQQAAFCQKPAHFLHTAYCPVQPSTVPLFTYIFPQSISSTHGRHALPICFMYDEPRTYEYNVHHQNDENCSQYNYRNKSQGRLEYY
jgi:hypothetical protein